MASTLSRRLKRKLDAFALSPAGLAVPAGLVAAYLRRTTRRSEWVYQGREALARQLREDGPVIIASWHARLLLGTGFWDPAWPPVLALTSRAFPAQMGGQVMKRFGIGTRALNDKKPARGDILAVAKAVREGTSLILQADGPLGPARQARTPVLDWARTTGRPIWLTGGSVSRYRQLDSWDRMVVPRSGGRATFLYRPWEVTVPKRISEAEMTELRARLTADLDAVTRDADRSLGHSDLIS